VHPVRCDDVPAPTATTPFALPQVPGRLWSWSREPAAWDGGQPGVIWRCPGRTDFWRTTEGVPNAHDGCALLTTMEGDFELTLVAVGAFADRYDQVGLMIVASEVLWLKAGIEVDGDVWLSAVHTREESDWSRERWHAPHVRLRAIRRNGTVEILVEEAASWRIFRTLYLPGTVGIGPYSCSPKGDGFQASVRDLTVRG
jgi:uncharacterized protein